MFQIITKPGCPYCEKAKKVLSALKYLYEEDEADTPEKIAAFKAKGFSTFPQIYHDDHLIGGYDNLMTVIHERLAW